MRRLELPPRDIDLIVLSHGHWDHVTGMDGLAREIGRAALPVLIHPEFWSRRRIALPGKQPIELPTASRAALEGAGYEITEERRPSFLLDGSLLVTGEVDRTTSFEHGFPHHEAHRGGDWAPDPLILDDQALVANVARPRPVRAHRLRALGDRQHPALRAQAHRGRPPARGVGGFHLGGPAFEPIIGPTCDALAELAPDHLVPTHCTGWRAVHALARRMPEAFIQNSVGTRLEFGQTSG